MYAFLFRNLNIDRKMGYVEIFCCPFDHLEYFSNCYRSFEEHFYAKNCCFLLFFYPSPELRTMQLVFHCPSYTEVNKKGVKPVVEDSLITEIKYDITIIKPRINNNYT